MPRNKRQAPDTGDRERAQALAEYSVWLEAPGAGTDPASARGVDVASETQLVEALLRLKASGLGSADVGEWTGPMIEQLLTRLVPRTVIQLREASMDLVPALTRFFVFLQETGRWSRRSMRPETAARTLADLEFAVLEAADDPSRRSFSTNLIGYGLEHGLDPRDETALLGYMDWYDSLPDDERTQLTRTGRLADPTVPYDPATMRALPGERGLADARGTAEGTDEREPVEGADARGTVEGTDEQGTVERADGPDGPGEADSAGRRSTAPASQEPWPAWPPAPHRVGEPSPDVVPEAADTAPGAADAAPETAGAASATAGAALDADLVLRAEMAARVPFVRAAVALLEVVGGGVPVTSTAGLDRTATRDVLARLDSGRRVHSMWEAPEIVGPWIALLDGGWLVREGRRVVPTSSAADGTTPVLAPTPDPEGFLRFARALIVSLLAGLGMRGPEEGGLRALPGTFAALRAACSDAGTADGPAVAGAAATAAADATAAPVGDVRADLEELVALGLLRREGDAVTGSPILRAALDEAERILRTEGRWRGTL